MQRNEVHIKLLYYCFLSSPTCSLEMAQSLIKYFFIIGNFLHHAYCEALLCVVFNLLYCPYHPGAANCVTGQKKNLLAMAKTWYNQLSLNTLKLMQANKAVCGFHLGYITDEQLLSSNMSKLLELYGQGKIKPRIDSCYHFQEVSLIRFI